ncbi:MAG: hypothetical protein ACYC6Y_29605 [Thermoguttaceae bacterium]
MWNWRAAMWMPVLLLVAAVAGERSDAGAAEKESKAPAGLDPTVLRYLPDDCRVIAQVDVDAMFRTELGRKLVSACEGDDYSRLLSLLKLEKEQVQRLVIGSHAFGDDTEAQGVTILFCKLPVFQVAPTNAWTAEEVGPHTIWARSDKKTSAFSVVEERIVLTGTPEAIGGVLRRNGPAELPAPLGAACQKVKDNAAVTFSFLPTTMFPGTTDVPGVNELLERVDAVNVEMEFGAVVPIRVSAICRDEAAAQQINGVGIAFRALLLGQGMEQLDANVRQIVRSLDSRVDGSVLTVSAEVPGELVSVGSKLASNTASVVQGSMNGPLSSIPVGNTHFSPYSPGTTLSPVGGASPQAAVVMPASSAYSIGSGYGSPPSAVPTSTFQPAPAAAAYPAAPATPAAVGPPAGSPYGGSTPSYTAPPPAAAYNPQPAPPQAVAPAATSAYSAAATTPVPVQNPYCTATGAGTVPATGYSAALHGQPVSTPAVAAPGTPRYPPIDLYSPTPSGNSWNYPLSSPAAGQRVPNPAIQIAEVIRMSEAGVDEQVLVRYLRKGWLAAALTADDLILLTEKKVSRTVIVALQDLPTK